MRHEPTIVVDNFNSLLKLKKITKSSHKKIEDLHHIYNISNKAIQTEPMDTSSLISSSDSQKNSNSGDIQKINSYLRDKTTKKLKIGNLFDQKQTLQNQKALSSAGNEAQAIRNATNYFIHQAPVNFNFIKKYKNSVKNILSPPNEPSVKKKLRNTPSIQKSTFKISDEMIRKYQKFDILLIHIASSRNEDFYYSTGLRAFLEYYFIKFEDKLTPKFHQISQENMNFILNPIDLFTEQEHRYMGKRGEFCHQETTKINSLPTVFTPE